MDPFLASALVQTGTSLVGSYLNSGDEGLEKVSNFDRGQQKFHNQYVKQTRDLQNGGYNQATQHLLDYLNPNSGAYKAFEDQYMQQFQNQTLPGIAERFAGAGALSSSGFGQALSSAGSELQGNLAALHQQGGLNAAQGILNQYNQQSSNVYNAQPFSYMQQDKGSGFLPNALNAFSQNVNPGMFNGWQGQGNQNQGAQQNSSFNTQFPLTNYYDQMFRTQGAY